MLILTRGWSVKDWTVSGDRVRGDKSEVGNASDSYGESTRGHWNFVMAKHSHILLARSPRPDFTAILISRPWVAPGLRANEQRSMTGSGTWTTTMAYNC